MLTLTSEQYALLSLPDPHEFAPDLAQEIRSDFASWIKERTDDEMTEQVMRSYQYASEVLRLTHLPTLVAWVKADIVWAPGLCRDLSTELWMRQSKHPNLTARDILSGLHAFVLWPEEKN